MRFQGFLVRISTYKPIDGEKTHIGVLGPVSDREMTLIREGQPFVLDRDMIASARLHWEEDEE